MTTHEPQTQEYLTDRETGPRTTHLEYLDSLRGIASMYVMIGHVFIDVGLLGLGPVMKPLRAVFDFGKLGVALFIVLSGYCLMLPVARSGAYQLRSPFRIYVLRRAWRIYPAYLAAMVASLMMFAVLPSSVASRSFWLSTFQPAFDRDIILSHLFLYHNLDNRWLYKINAPFWSVATEWQIYFLFPLILLPLAHRVGAWCIVPVGLLVGLLPILLFRRFETAAPWFIGLFAMGMVSATIAHSPNPTYRAARSWAGWGATTLVGCVTLAGLLFAMNRLSGSSLSWKQNCFSQASWGLVVAVGLVWLAVRPPGGRVHAAVIRILHAKLLRLLGTCSYSLYLTHGIAACLAWIGMSYVVGDLPSSIAAGSALVAGCAASIAFAAVFYIIFERPFLRRRVLLHDSATTAQQPARVAEVAGVGA